MKEKFEIKENKEEKQYPYDALVLLSGGTRKIKTHEGKEKFYPTDYRDSDEFGMLGAGMRMAAVVDIYLEGKTKNIVFTTGKTEKMKKLHGEDIPSEAKVYKDKFLRVLEGLKKRKDYKEKFKDLEEPNITLEEKSVSTLTNIKEVLKIIKDKKWKKIALVSSDYHIPRTKALFEKALKDNELETNIDFISAEQQTKESHPGKYDDVIDKYYGTDEAKERIENEEIGVKDFEEGKYAKKEFQLERKNEE